MLPLFDFQRASSSFTEQCFTAFLVRTVFCRPYRTWCSLRCPLFPSQERSFQLSYIIVLLVDNILSFCHWLLSSFLKTSLSLVLYLSILLSRLFTCTSISHWFLPFLIFCDNLVRGMPVLSKQSCEYGCTHCPSPKRKSSVTVSPPFVQSSMCIWGLAQRFYQL